MPVGDQDWVSFDLDERSNVVVETSGQNDIDDTCLTLYDDIGDYITSNDDTGSTLWSRIEIVLDPGTYYICVEEVGNDDIIAPYYLNMDASPESTGNPWIDIFNPDANAIWIVGQEYEILWTSQNVPDNVVIDLFLDGVHRLEIEGRTDNDGCYNWWIPEDLESSGEYQVVITDVDDHNTKDWSDMFEIRHDDEDNGSNGDDAILPWDITAMLLSIIVAVPVLRPRNSTQSKKPKR